MCVSKNTINMCNVCVWVYRLYKITLPFIKFVNVCNYITGCDDDFYKKTFIKLNGLTQTVIMIILLLLLC